MSRLRMFADPSYTGLDEGYLQGRILGLAETFDPDQSQGAPHYKSIQDLIDALINQDFLAHNIPAADAMVLSPAGGGDFVYPGGSWDPGELPTNNIGGFTIRGANGEWSFTVEGLDLSLAEFKALGASGRLFSTILARSDTISLFNGKDVFNAYGGNDVITDGGGSNIIHGGAGNDRITMYGFVAGRNSLYGDAGNDSLFGAGGIDLLDGGIGNDTLYGAAGNDTIKGGAGVDRLQGGLGHDYLHGGPGADRFVFKYAVESTVGARGRDSIMDFSHAQHDRIDLSYLDANLRAAGNQAFHFIGTNAFTHHAGELRYVHAGSNTYVYGDMDGNGAADIAVQLVTRLPALAAGDFYL